MQSSTAKYYATSIYYSNYNPLFAKKLELLLMNYIKYMDSESGDVMGVIDEGHSRKREWFQIPDWILQVRCHLD